MFSILDSIEEGIKKWLIEVISVNIQYLISSLNDQVKEVVNMVSISPESYNQELFTFVDTIHKDVILPFCATIISGILCLEIIHMVLKRNTMHDFQSFEVFKYLMKAWFSVYLAEKSFTIIMSLFDASHQMIGKVVGIMSIETEMSEIAFQSFIESLKGETIGTLIMIVFETGLIKFSLDIVGILVWIICLGRMLEIYIFSSLCAIPFSTFGNDEAGQIGKGYIKYACSLALQGVIIVIILGMYSTLIAKVKWNAGSVDVLLKSLHSVLGYGVLLGVMLFKSGSFAQKIMSSH